jgi:lyso-ornithine lipid O-acyltransferase
MTNNSLSQSSPALDSGSHSKPGLTSSRRNPVRAVRRLVGLARVCAKGCYRVISRSVREGWSAPMVAVESQIWAQRLLSSCNIIPRVHGELPNVAAVFVANHRSYIDIAVLNASLPCSFMAKSELASWPVIGYTARKGNVIFVKRADRDSRRRAREAVATRLLEGISTVVFVEGTTHAGPGILDFSPGIFVMAAGNNFPVVPIAFDYPEPEDAWIGNDDFVSHFLRVFSKREVRAEMSVGPVLQDSDPEKLRDAAWNWVSDEVTRLQRVRQEPTWPWRNV